MAADVFKLIETRFEQDNSNLIQALVELSLVRNRTVPSNLKYQKFCGFSFSNLTAACSPGSLFPPRSEGLGGSPLTRVNKYITQTLTKDTNRVFIVTSENSLTTFLCGIEFFSTGKVPKVPILCFYYGQKRDHTKDSKYYRRIMMIV